MEKEELIALGTKLGIEITDALADEIVKLHVSKLDNNYVTKARFDEVNEKNKTLTTQLSERDNSISKLKKDLEDKPSKEKVDELEKQLADKDKEHELALAQEIKKVKVISEIAGKVHDNDLVISQLNLDEITVTDNGTMIGLKEQLDALKESKGFLFIDDKVVTTPAGEPTNNGATNNANGGQVNPAASFKSPNVVTQPNSETKPEGKVDKQRDDIIQKMLAKQKLNQSKQSKGDE